MTLGQRIQQHRTNLNLSQEALGEKLGVTRQAVHKWEADGAVPDTDKLIALSKLFGITLNELLQVEEPKKEEASVTESAASEEKVDPTSAKPGVNLKLRTTLMAVAILILGVASLISANNIASLQKEVTSLKQQLAQPAGLDPAAPLVADFSYHMTPSGDWAAIHLDLLPYQLPDELAVTFTVTSLYDIGDSKTATATRDAGGHYTADLSVQYPHLITAAFSDGVNEYAQSLVRLNFTGGNSWTSEILWNK